MSCHILTLFPKGQAQTSLSLHSRSNINVVEGFHLWYVLPSLLGILFFFCVLLSCRKQPLPRDFPFIALDMFSTFKVTFTLWCFQGMRMSQLQILEILTLGKFHELQFLEKNSTKSNFRKVGIQEKLFRISKNIP